MSRSPVPRDMSARAMQALSAELVTPPDLEARLLHLADGGLPARAMQALSAELVTPPDLEARLLHLAELEDSLLDLVTEDLTGTAARGRGVRLVAVDGSAVGAPEVIESKWAQLANARSRAPRPPRRPSRTTLLMMSAASSAIIGAAAWFLSMPPPAPKPPSSRLEVERLAERSKAGSVKTRADLFGSSSRPEQEIQKLREQLKASETKAQQLEEQLKASEKRARQLEDEVQGLRAQPR